MRFSFYPVVLLVTLLAASSLTVSCQKREKQKEELVFLSGAGMKEPVTELAEMYEQETGIKVQIHFDGSSILRDYILNFKTGDIFLPGDKKNLDTLAEQNLVEDQSFLAWHVVSILVAPEQADRIKSLDDLARDGVRLAISNPRLASLGKIVMNNIINKHPRGADILKNVVVYGSSSQDVLRIYREGNIDAIIEWDVMAASDEGKGLQVVPLPPPYQVRDKLYVGLLSTSRDPVRAKRFYKYLTENGRKIFRKHGYDTTPPEESLPR